MKQRQSRQAFKRIFELQCEVCKAMSHSLRLEIVELMSRDEIPALVVCAEPANSRRTPLVTSRPPVYPLIIKMNPCFSIHSTRFRFSCSG